ncbi:phosphatidylserine synthase [Staphylococcus xylosus]|uniref:hypothetical protein n=1 Tax=Staphylococcus xylosus TaxID=1288 RepID=UPI000499E923|nr:hypothetical protein [Staphylococcus xylosus]AID02017.1 phosphatidylserine synthase [Staphylococcus xylosus]MEB8098492.1 hypothetical protein [Staphylococcus xylosus]
MDKSQFIQTMTQMLKWDGDEYSHRDKVLSILRYSKIDFERTTSFAKIYQCYKDIPIRVKIPLLKEVKEIINSIEKLVNYIYQETEEYDLRNSIIRSKFVENEKLDIVSNTVLYLLQSIEEK